ncbi:MAG: GNAT family N-acetyltransferase [Actinobacteria bacterium]|nr:GNAT family N-acetyltransferase [Actinomycetota bacterium]
MRRRRLPTTRPQPILRGDGVVLRRPEHDDVPSLVALEDDEMARRFGLFGPSTATLLHAAVDQWHRGWDVDRSVANFLSCRGADGAIVGGVELRHQGDGVAQLSWWTFAPYRRRGWAGAAVRLLCHWAFTDLRLARLEALVEPDNVASLGTARAAGFTEEGLLRSKQTIGPRRADLVLLARVAADPAPEDLTAGSSRLSAHGVDEH